MPRRSRSTPAVAAVRVATVVVGIVILGIVVAIVGAGCSGGDDAGAPEATSPPTAPTTFPTTTISPAQAGFCDEMIALDERIEESSGAEAADDVIETYSRLVPGAPLEIAADLEGVLERLRVERAGGTLDEAARAVADDAALRVSAWVDLNCHGVANNPGPPATPPA
jgi:hypothetical protein